MDRSVSLEQVRIMVDGRREDDVRRALAATRRARPADALAFFVATLGRRIETERIPTGRRGIPAVAIPDDPYGP
jgi:hypothetical protein